MSDDLSGMLSAWPYEPGKISVRRIRGANGKIKIQLRLDLGILQMETEGRPDGRRPHGCESLLAHYKGKLAAHRAEHGNGEGFTIGPAAYERIRSEAFMYYHRYLSEFALEDYAGVVRDTQRNIEALDLCHRYGGTEASRMGLEQYRPYIIMMHTRAKALLALARDDLAAAREAAEAGMAAIGAFADEHGRSEAFAESGEAAVLQALLDEIQRREPVDPRSALKGSLARAIEEERYEDAARLRDQLRGMRPSGDP